MVLNFKKRIIALISAVAMLNSVAVTAFAQGTSAGGGGAPGNSGSVHVTTDLNSLASEVGYVYDYVDPKDIGTILGVASRLNSLKVDEIADSAVESLMTEEFVGKYESKIEAKRALVTLLGTSLGVYFSKDKAEIAPALKSADDKILETFEKVFGMERTVEWFDLFLLTKKDAQDIAGGAEKRIWALGSKDGTTADKSELFETMDELQIKAMNARLTKEAYADMAENLAEIGWTVENIVAVCRNISSVKDQSNLGEFALLKAAARSSAVVSGLDINLVNAGLDLNENVISYVPGEKDEFDMSLDVLDWNVTNYVGYGTTNTDLISFEEKQDDKIITVKINEGKKGTADIILRRDPLGVGYFYCDPNTDDGKDWIVRFRIVVANEIGQATDFELNQETGEFTWSEVDNAAKYSVDIYKDGVKIDTVEVTDEKVNVMEWAEANGNGTYTIDVTAYGDIVEEVGEVSECPLEFDYAGALGTVDKPEWGIDNFVLSWNEIENATEYEVKLYKGSDTEPCETVTVTDGTSYNFNTYFQDKTGIFYATVQAKGQNGLVGGVSEKSEGKYVERHYSASGIAFLEAYEKGKVKEDNSGIKVSIPALGISTVTDADGKYTLENIPVSNDSYTVWFEYKYYLKGVQTITVTDENVMVDEEILYFGDFRNSGTVEKIDHVDIPVITNLFGINKAQHPDRFDDYMDICDDDVINGYELSVIIRNINKKAE